MYFIKKWLKWAVLIENMGLSMRSLDLAALQLRLFISIHQTQILWRCVHSSQLISLASSYAPLKGQQVWFCRDGTESYIGECVAYRSFITETVPSICREMRFTIHWVGAGMSNNDTKSGSVEIFFLMLVKETPIFDALWSLKFCRPEFPTLNNFYRLLYIEKKIVLWCSPMFSNEREHAYSNIEKSHINIQ